MPLDWILIFYKHNVFFSKSVPETLKRNSKFKIGYIPVRYLGVPLHHKKLQVVHFQPIVDKVKRKIDYFALEHPLTNRPSGNVEMCGLSSNILQTSSYESPFES